ncbi:MAG: nucleotidyltransferase domain-containing protein [Armatimonadota bacterium]
MEMTWLGAEPGNDAEVLLCQVLDACDRLGTAVYIYGGYAVEAHVGRRVRAHSDVDFVAWRHDWPALQVVVARAGLDFACDAPTALHVRQSGRTIADVLLAEQHPDGFPFVRAPLGANPLPPSSFAEALAVNMWGRRAHVVSLECLLVMKASGNFNGPRQPPDPKHARDLELIRSLLPEAALARLLPYCRVIPAPPEDRATLSHVDA